MKTLLLSLNLIVILGLAPNGSSLIIYIITQPNPFSQPSPLPKPQSALIMSSPLPLSDVTMALNLAQPGPASSLHHEASLFKVIPASSHSKKAASLQSPAKKTSGQRSSSAAILSPSGQH